MCQPECLAHTRSLFHICDMNEKTELRSGREAGSTLLDPL